MLLIWLLNYWNIKWIWALAQIDILKNCNFPRKLMLTMSTNFMEYHLYQQINILHEEESHTVTDLFVHFLLLFHWRYVLFNLKAAFYINCLTFLQCSPVYILHNECYFNTLCTVNCLLLEHWNTNVVHVHH